MLHENKKIYRNWERNNLSARDFGRLRGTEWAFDCRVVLEISLVVLFLLGIDADGRRYRQSETGRSSATPNHQILYIFHWHREGEKGVELELEWRNAETRKICKGERVLGKSCEMGQWPIGTNRLGIWDIGFILLGWTRAPLDGKKTDQYHFWDLIPRKFGTQNLIH